MSQWQLGHKFVRVGSAMLLSILPTVLAAVAVPQMSSPRSSNITAQSFLKNKQYAQYAEALKSGASSGDQQCEDALANLYFDGRVLAKNRPLALKIWAAQITKGYAPAMLHLAMSSDNPKDKKNVALYEKLSKQKAPYNLYGLAMMSAYVKKNPADATKYLKQAGDAGLREARLTLAHLLYDGDVIPKDLKKARTLAQQSANQADLDSMLLLAEMQMYGIGGEKECETCLQTLHALAEQNVAEAENRLGHAYRSGICVFKDIKESIKWLSRAAERNYPPALNELADIYAEGDGVQQDYEKSFAFDSRSATQPEANGRVDAIAASQYNLGLRYENGQGVQKDLVKARACYEKAAQLNNPHACNNLQNMCRFGYGGPKQPERCDALLKKGVANGCWMACVNLGRQYLDGTPNGKRNIPEAIKLFKRSLELRPENADANYYLGLIYRNEIKDKNHDQIARQYFEQAIKYDCTYAIRYLGTESIISIKSPIPPPAHQSKYVDYKINQSQARFFISVPKDKPCKGDYGLIVYLDTTDRYVDLPSGWPQVLNQNGFIYICPQNAGNDTPPPKRAGLAVLAAQEAMRRYKIDTAKIFIAGTCGSARQCSKVAMNQSDLFRGTIQSFGNNYFRSIKKAETSLEKDDQTMDVFEASPEEIASARQKVRFALIGNSDLKERQYVRIVYKDGFLKDGFNARFFEQKSPDGSDCSGEVLQEVLNFL